MMTNKMMKNIKFHHFTTGDSNPAEGKDTLDETHPANY